MTKNTFTYKETSLEIIDNLYNLPAVVSSKVGDYIASPIYWIILSNSLLNTTVEYYDSVATNKG